MGKAKSLDFSDYARLLRRSWKIVAGAGLIGLLLAGAISLALRPVYTAETELFVATQSSGTAQELQQGNTFTQARVQSYAETVETPAVLQPVIDELGLPGNAAELAERVGATADANTVIISITASEESPALSAAIAQSVADSMIDVVQSLESPTSGGPSPVKLSVITPAVAPTEPSSPNLRLNLAVGLVAGLLFGTGFAVLRSAINTKVRGEEDLRRVTEAPVLGGIAFDSDAVKKPLLTQTSFQGQRAESFRQLRTNLQFAHVSQKSSALLVTSSLPSEGKSTTATNLAISMAQSGQHVVLVDADLRRPRIDGYLGLERNAGLTTALIGSAEVEDLLQPWGEHELYVLTSGRIPPNPSELLGSNAMKGLIAELEGSFDAVIIDAPPLLPVTDAAVLSQQVGGVVLVVGSSKVKRPDLERSLNALKLIEANLLGIVLNLLPGKGTDAYTYSYLPHEDAPDTKPPLQGAHMKSSSGMGYRSTAQLARRKQD